MMRVEWVSDTFTDERSDGWLLGHTNRDWSAKSHAMPHMDGSGLPVDVDTIHVWTIRQERRKSHCRHSLLGFLLPAGLSYNWGRIMFSWWLNSQPVSFGQFVPMSCLQRQCHCDQQPVRKSISLGVVVNGPIPKWKCMWYCWVCHQKWSVSG